MTIHEVMEYGPVIFGSEDTDTLITINGAYLNWWAGDYQGNYQNTDCRYLSHEGGLYGLDITEAIRKAEEYFQEMLAEEDAD